MGGIVVGRKQQQGWIQIALDTQVPGHCIPRLGHSPEGYQCKRRGDRPGTSAADRDRTIQLRAAMVDIPVRVDLYGIRPLGDLPQSDSVAALPEEHRIGSRSDGQHLFNGIELIRQGELHIEGVVRINGTIPDHGNRAIGQHNRRGVSAGCRQAILHLQAHAVHAADR